MLSSVAVDWIEALVNGLWPALLLVAGWETTRQLSPRILPSIRYIVWWIALIVVIWISVPVDLPAIPETDAPVSSGPPASETTSAPSTEPSASDSDVGLLRELVLPPGFAVLVLGFWALGAAVLLVRLTMGLRRLSSLKRRARPLTVEQLRQVERWQERSGARRHVVFRVSDEIDAPALLGPLAPTVLLPSSMIERFSGDELAAVTVHELAHLRRWDDWTQVVQRCLTALFFFHPVVGWISRRMDLDRELACDEWTLARTGMARESYARSLLRVGRLALTLRRLPAVSMAGRLRSRVLALTGAAPDVRLRRRALLLVGLGTLVFAYSHVPVLAVNLGGEPEPPSIDAGASISIEMEALRALDPERRALAAYRLGQMRGAAIPAIPELVRLLRDDATVVRRRGLTSWVWGRPSERRGVTSVSEEAVKALLHIGRPSLAALEVAVDQGNFPDDHMVVWALRLLRDFD